MKYMDNNVPCQITFDTGQWKTLEPHAVWPQPCPSPIAEIPTSIHHQARPPAYARLSA